MLHGFTCAQLSVSHVLQGQLYPGLVSLETTQDIDVPKQLQTLHHALEFTLERVTTATQADICSLLAQMCHPDMTQRISASAVADISWLRDAAAKPLASCPVHHIA